MTRHVGVSVLYSVLIVVFFAVVLYQPDKLPEQPGATDAAQVGQNPVAVTDSTETTTAPPPPVPTAPVTEASPVASAYRKPDVHSSAPTVPASVREAVNRQTDNPALGATNHTSQPAAPVVKTSSIAPRTAPSRRPANPPLVESPGFTHVAEGETLADVAMRLYGSQDAVPRLWMANRDIIPKRDAPLVAGTVLRAP